MLVCVVEQQWKQLVLVRCCLAAMEVITYGGNTCAVSWLLNSLGNNGIGWWLLNSNRNNGVGFRLLSSNTDNDACLLLFNWNGNSGAGSLSLSSNGINDERCCAIIVILVGDQL